MVNKLCSLCLHVHTAHTSKHRPNKLWQLHIFLFHFARHLPATIGVCELFFPLSLRLGVCSFVAQNLRQYELILAACHYKFLFCNGKTVFVTPKQKKKRKKSGSFIYVVRFTGCRLSSGSQTKGMKNCIERKLFECEKEQQHHHHQSNTKEKNSFGVCTKVLNTKKGILLRATPLSLQAIKKEKNKRIPD